MYLKKDFNISIFKLLPKRLGRVNKITLLPESSNSLIMYVLST